MIEESATVLDILTKTPGGQLVLIIILATVIVFGLVVFLGLKAITKIINSMDSRAGATEDQTEVYTDLIKQLAAASVRSSDNEARQTQALQDTRDAVIASTQMLNEVKVVVEQSGEVLDKTYEQHIVSHARVDDEHAEMMSGVNAVKESVEEAANFTTREFDKREQAVIEALSQMELRIIAAIREDANGEIVAAVQSELHNLIGIIERYIAQQDPIQP